MTAFFIYCLKVVACSFCFAGCYWLFLRQGRFHRWNRRYILAAVLLSCGIPLLSVPINFSASAIDKLPVFNALFQYQYQLEAITIYAQPAGSNVNTLLPLPYLLSGLYFIVVGSLFLMLIRGLFHIRQLRRRSQRVQAGSVKIYMTKDTQAPYSFFSSVFWNENLPLNSAEGKCVLQHELVHQRQGHSFDKLFMQSVCIIFWVNPFFWLLRHELSLVHEYIADEESVADKDTGQLSALILCSVYPQHYMQFISPFFQTPIKQRLIMLANKTPIKFKMQRKSVAIFIPLLFIAFAVCNIHIEAIAQDNTPKAVEQVQQATKVEQKAKPKVVEVIELPIPVAVVEVKPKFQGGNENEFTKWVAKNMTYPQEARDKNIQGRVTLSFVVDEKGKVTDVEVLRSADSLLADMAVSTVSASPDWTPGKHKGKPVPVKYTFPVIFQLTENKTVKTSMLTNDGANDLFEIGNFALYRSIELIVANRWGNEVYRKKDYKGEAIGSGLADGTYFYALRLIDEKDVNTKYAGSIEIVEEKVTLRSKQEEKPKQEEG